MTLYLKYRPQTTSELNLTEVKKTLEGVLTSGKIPHAWLFTGPKGTGKTSSARILAKAVNCEKKRGFEPCNECEMCQEITLGNAVDVVEIDAASNRGIDEIRALREKIKLAPMRAKYKIYIIDEVHMLTSEAANALLKTLEEPPENTLFILCTTEADKIPETVVSRCTRIMFKKPTKAEAIESLERVVEGEKLKVTKKALEIIAEAARGSFRDGTKILEQIAMGTKEITEDEVRKVTGALEITDPEKFIELLINGDTDGCLRIVTELDKQGINQRRFVEMLALELREQLLKEVSQRNTGITNREALVELITGLDKAYERMKTAAVTQLPLEIWIIENTNGKTENKPKEERKEVRETKAEVKAIEAKPDVPSGKGKYSLEDLAAKWPEIMKLVKPQNHSVEGLLRSTKPINFDGERLELEVFYKFHKDKLETEKCRQIVETAIMEAFSVSTAKLYLTLGQKVKGAKEEVSAANVSEDIVKAAEEIFKAEVL